MNPAPPGKEKLFIAAHGFLALINLVGLGAFTLVIVVAGTLADPATGLFVAAIYVPLAVACMFYASRYMLKLQVGLAVLRLRANNSNEPGAMYRPLIPVRYAVPAVKVLRIAVAIAVVAGIGARRFADFDVLRQPWFYAITPLFIFCEIYLNELNCGRTERRIRMRTGAWANWKVDLADLARAIGGGFVGLVFQLPVLALLFITPEEEFVVPALLSFWCWGVILSWWAWLNMADWLLARKMRPVALQAR